MGESDNTTDIERDSIDQQLRATLEDQAERIAHLEQANERIKSQLDQQSESTRPHVTRRQALGLLGGSALLAGGSASGAAASSGPEASQWSETDADGLLELPTNDGIDVTRTRTEQLNGVLYAKPGEVQAAIDALYEQGVDGVVRLHPETYDEGSEIHVKPGVTLDFNGALLTVSGDHNGLFMDNHTEATDVDIEIETASDSFSSDAVVLDSSRIIDPDAPRHENIYSQAAVDLGTGNWGVSIDGILRGNEAGTGLALRDYGPGGIFTNHIDLDIFFFEIGILADNGDGGWINGVDIQTYLQGNRVQIDHRGHGAFNTMVYGHMQNGWWTDYEIRNQTTNDAGSCTFVGQVWDTAGVNKSALAGPNINVITDGHMAHEMARNSPEAGPGTVTTSWHHNKRRVGHANTGSVYQWEYTDDGLVLKHWGTGGLWEWERDGRVGPGDGGYLGVTPADLSQQAPNAPGELAIDDGSNTSSGKVELAVGQATGANWYTMGGDTIENSVSTN